jgi:hypothetical protein
MNEINYLESIDDRLYNITTILEKLLEKMNAATHLNQAVDPHAQADTADRQAPGSGGASSEELCS